MIILTIRTDKPEAEIGLYKDTQKLVYQKWLAHRQLTDMIHTQIAKNLQSVGKQWNDIQSIVVYKGTGSFTGLRIGVSVANSLAYSLGVPIVATNGDWIETGLKKLQDGADEKTVLPEYGSPVRTTLPKK